MRCSEVENTLNAWADEELSDSEKKGVAGHLKQCANCSKKAEEIKRLNDALANLPPIYAPKTLSGNVLKVFRSDFEKPTAAELWRSLTVSMRSVLCGAALAGLLCGVVLGTTLMGTASVSTSDPYKTFYVSESFYP